MVRSPEQVRFPAVERKSRQRQPHDGRGHEPLAEDDHGSRCGIAARRWHRFNVRLKHMETSTGARWPPAGGLDLETSVYKLRDSSIEHRSHKRKFQGNPHEHEYLADNGLHTPRNSRTTNRNETEITMKTYAGPSTP